MCAYTAQQLIVGGLFFMSSIKIRTDKYAKELRHLLPITWEHSPCEVAGALLHVIYSIVIRQNPVYKNSPKLQELATGLNDTPQYTYDQARLVAFIKTHTELYFDGYITFCMDDYRAQLDMILYKIVKKINSR